MLDNLEKRARIRNLNADTALKMAQLRTEKVKVGAAIFTAVAALGGAVGGLIKWLTH